MKISLLKHNEFYLFLVIAAYLVGQVARNALFLGRFKASLLPFADLTVFLLVTVAAALYVRAGRRMGLEREDRGVVSAE